jgi:serine/threonine protein kinase
MLKLRSLWQSIVNRKLPWGVVTVVGVSLGVTGLVLGAKQLGWREAGELAAYDGSIRWRKPLPPDSRLPIVAITEADIARQGTWPLPDRTIAIGTRGYTPPEQYAGQPNYPSDIYALGTIAIETLTNTQPCYLPVDETTGNLIWQDRATVSPALAKVLDKWSLIISTLVISQQQQY